MIALVLRYSGVSIFALLLSQCVITLLLVESCSAQPLPSSETYRTEIYPEDRPECSVDENAIVIEIKDGVVALLRRRGPDARAKISSDGSMLMFSIGAVGCRYGMILSRSDSRTADEVQRRLARGGHDGWEDAPPDVRLAQAAEGCARFVVSIALSMNRLTFALRYMSDDAEPAPESSAEGIGRGACLIRAASGPLD